MISTQMLFPDTWIMGNHLGAGQKHRFTGSPRPALQRLLISRKHHNPLEGGQTPLQGPTPELQIHNLHFKSPQVIKKKKKKSCPFRATVWEPVAQRFRGIVPLLGHQDLSRQDESHGLACGPANGNRLQCRPLSHQVEAIHLNSNLNEPSSVSKSRTWELVKSQF